MGEDTNIPSDSVILANGEHIQILNENNVYEEDQASSMCTVILDPSNMTLIPVVPVVEGEEVVMYNIVDDTVKVEVTDENEDVYTQEVPKPTKSYTKSSRQGPHICKYCNKSFAQVGYELFLYTLLS